MQYRFFKDYPVRQVYRVLLDQGARVVEALAGNVVVYEKGVNTFSVHHVELPDGTCHHLFADEHGWAFKDDDIKKLMNQRILEPVL